ncbi:larval cuticle protein III/IV-like [Anthonomus grandis grandis]|uniref:larval cuticle protein III/IV-like n=1 Tax=Anthonomus grandis grandis TaxID=2921223 RepID=UPI002166AC82|nr:larval cuticle protein III/IV-like [Anthonomus grandis grandis]
MLSKILIAFCAFTVVLSASFSRPNVDIISSRADISPDGSFQWSYQSADGTSQEQSGRPDVLGQIVQGNAEWYDPQGVRHNIVYVADANGYQAASADIPVGPPIPAAILKSLQWNARHPEEQ